MNAGDLFHVGIVTDDLNGTLDELTTSLGYEWCAQTRVSVPVTLPDGDTVVDLRFTYSRTTPRLEIVQSIPGTVWTPAKDAAVHHLGYWSDDVEADAADLERRGYRAEAVGRDGDGTARWTYHRRADGPRIELVSRAIQAGLEHYWSATG